MPRYFVQVEGDLYYQFSTRTEAYPDAIREALGVFNTGELPDDAIVTTAGTFADWGIIRVRIALENGEDYIRLCDVDSLTDAIATLPGDTAFGSTILKVHPVRKRILF